MTFASALAIAVVVWSISMLRSVPLRALVYSLPVPMSLALVGSGVTVDGIQLVGVVLLVLFFAIVAALHLRLRWPILLADATAAIACAAAGWALPRGLPLVPALIGVVVLWLLALAVAPNATTEPVAMAPARRSVPQSGATLAGVTVTALAVLALGDQLAGLVVTFPYAGVLVAVEVRHQLTAFTWQFARTAIALVAFLTGYALLQDHGVAPALIAGWLAFAACVVPLTLWSRHRTTHRSTT